MENLLILEILETLDALENHQKNNLWLLANNQDYLDHQYQDGSIHMKNNYQK